MSTYLQDLGNTYAINAVKQPTHSTARKAENNSLDMTDFLQLMVVQLQNQTMDNTTDTSDMLNQLVQMQMVTAMANMTDASVMSYASSLVGKVVTIGITDGNTLEEREILVMGTGTMDGKQVIFGSDGKSYSLNQIMAVGRLPNEDGTYGDVQKPEEGEGAEGSGENTENPGETGGTPEAGGTGTENPEYSGEQGAPTA